jgi:hypothetical protein
MPRINGDEIHGEVVSSNASAGVAFTLYKQATATAYTPTSTEIITVTDIIFVSTAGGVYNLVFYPAGGSIADGAGLRIAKGNASALGGLAHHFETPRTGPKGYLPALISAAGQVDAVITGYVSQA